jgi:hypothetical protein
MMICSSLKICYVNQVTNLSCEFKTFQKGALLPEQKSDIVVLPVRALYWEWTNYGKGQLFHVTAQLNISLLMLDTIDLGAASFMTGFDCIVKPSGMLGCIGTTKSDFCF